MDYDGLRRRMVEGQLRRRNIRDERVLKALEEIPRHEFMPERVRARAYTDGPESIGGGQTISQPYIVALMTEALALEGSEKILEIGTGSGYQTAILARLGACVYSIERIPELSERAGEILNRLGILNVRLHVGDGTLGLPEHAPFDRIMVTAGAPEIPRTLLGQLRPGGAMVIPVGDLSAQELLRVVSKEGAEPSVERICGCRFVPLKGKKGW